ncbi:hypothetical protein HanIR_Chr15g0784981 [Helianthus annuus]|nr:hypothetical protein HanIR_Chr15g0784981 [Helianthus annuus]
MCLLITCFTYHKLFIFSLVSSFSLFLCFVRLGYLVCFALGSPHALQLGSFLGLVAVKDSWVLAGA